MILPPLYAILDAGCFSDRKAMFAAAGGFVEGGVTLLQYRNKPGNAREMLEDARELKRLVGLRVRLIVNDRADLCLAADLDGVHVGQDDLSAEAVRRIIGWGPVTSAAKAALELRADGRPEGRPLQSHAEDRSLRSQTESPVSFDPRLASEKRRREPGPPTGRQRWLGVSTHNPEQLGIADKTSADYLAIGPVFATSSKANPDPVVGLQGVRGARQLTSTPLVAIGGITRANARAVIEAGADSVAVISDLLTDPRKSAEEFLQLPG